jgi:hypothetical protein
MDQIIKFLLIYLKNIDVKIELDGEEIVIRLSTRKAVK